MFLKGAAIMTLYFILAAQAVEDLVAQRGSLDDARILNREGEHTIIYVF